MRHDGLRQIMYLRLHFFCCRQAAHHGHAASHMLFYSSQASVQVSGCDMLRSVLTRGHLGKHTMLALHCTENLLKAL